MTAPSKILIAPLDWGLGHTTRCIPIINYLIAKGHSVYVAAAGAPAQLLSENIPGLNIIHLKGYGIRYSKNRSLFTLKILSQVPKILSAIKKEHRWLQEQQEMHHFDLVISDNRYGLYLDGVRNVILTHQLQIMSGSGKLADAVLRKLHYRMLNRFEKCWIADEAEHDGYSGRLAHPTVLPQHASYIGLLSQFSGRIPGHGAEIENRILILLSGPEPMRGQLENLVVKQARELSSFQFVIVGGNPLGAKVTGLPPHMTYYTHLNAKQLLPELQMASMVVCRSGYSTVMDLAVSGKRALLIPTPGQTEQEYLAEFLSAKQYFNYCKQELLQLSVQIPDTLAATMKPRPAKENKIQYLIDAILSDR